MKKVQQSIKIQYDLVELNNTILVSYIGRLILYLSLINKNLLVGQIGKLIYCLTLNCDIYIA